jgi:alanyl-tRNA synthetase
MTNDVEESRIINSRKIADHFRASAFLIADGVMPSGKQRGYILRRLIRKLLSSSLSLNIKIDDKSYYQELADSLIKIYDGYYPELDESKDKVVEILFLESQKYLKAVDNGKKEWQKLLSKSKDYSASELALKIWDLYQSNGVPFEVSESILAEHNLTFDKKQLDDLIIEHQQKSQQSSGVQFKSGLLEENQKTKKLHTLTHILHQSLREYFGDGVRQMGSAITTEKARFDFSYDKEITDNDLAKLTEIVQFKINQNLQMTNQIMTPEDAKKYGAIGLFGEKYGEVVTVYSLVDQDGKVYSKEFCGGPHINNTSEIGKFVIIKQKSIGQGLKRIEFDVA